MAFPHAAFTTWPAKKSWRRVKCRPMGPPMTLLKPWLHSDRLTGHSQVLVMTGARRRSGLALAHASPIGPPQSPTTIVT